MKYGKIDDNDLKMTFYPGDSAAEAVVLGDYGFVYFRINNKGDNWEMVYERHTRIKIFHRNAFSFGNVLISLYKFNSDEERVTSLKGTTYFIENGKIVKENLRKDNIFNEVITNRRLEEKFAMPSLREGCIIEYTYTISSEFFHSLPTWYFQYSIPVRKSSFNARLPEYFKYYSNLRGYLTLAENKTESRTETFTIPYQTQPQAGGLVERGTYQINSNSLIRHWVMENIPAFKTEPFMNHEKNFISSLYFELASFNFPGQQVIPFTDTWETVSKQLLEDEYFGGQIKHGVYLQEELSGICKGTMTDTDKASAVFSTVQKLFKWNGRYSVITSRSLRKVTEDKAGNSADINLVLISVLQDCGLKVIPVVLSTRENGIIMPTHPSINQLNHVVALVRTGGKSILLDATHPNIPPGLLPEDCLNGPAYLVQPNKEEKIQTDSLQVFATLHEADLQMDSTGKYRGIMTSTFQAYAALDRRERILNLESPEKILDEIRETRPELTFGELRIQNQDNLSADLIISCHLECCHNENPGMIYINPLTGSTLSDNLFKQEERLHPVDFVFRRQETYLFRLNIPDNHEGTSKN